MTSSQQQRSRGHQSFAEAEDRFFSGAGDKTTTGQPQQHGFSAREFMQVAQMFESNPNSHHHDIPFDDERAFAYGEHPGYHMRERIFSAFEVCSQDGDDSIDLGADGRAIEEPMYTMPMRPDEEFDLELDLDDENDFEGILTEFKKKPETELS